MKNYDDFLNTLERQEKKKNYIMLRYVTLR